MTKKLTQNKVARMLNRQVALKGVTSKTKGDIDLQTEKKLAQFSERIHKAKNEQFLRDLQNGKYDDLL